MLQTSSHRLGPTLGRAAKIARSAMDVRVSQYDVTPVQAHALMYLHQMGAQVPQQELTEFLRVKPSTANGVLDRMEEKGLVRRTVSGADARRRLIFLTEKGREYQARFAESFLTVEAVLVRDFSPEEQTLLLSFLDRVIKNLEEDLQA